MFHIDLVYSCSTLIPLNLHRCRIPEGFGKRLTKNVTLLETGLCIGQIYCLVFAYILKVKLSLTLSCSELCAKVCHNVLRVLLNIEYYFGNLILICHCQ